MNSRILREGLYFGEGPRWHEDRLWYSDFYDHAVHAVTEDGVDERVVEVKNQPSGLGWLPDGTLLVVSMKDRRLLRWDGRELAEHADLSPYATWHCNDMVVDAAGHAFVGNFGFDYSALMRGGTVESVPAVLCRIDPDGTVSIAAEGMQFQNGSVITPDGCTLIVAESFGFCLTAFDLAPDGSLSNRRMWADLRSIPVACDGICLDAEGAVWVANPIQPRCVRVAEGGEVLADVELSQLAFACMLGGADGRQLFVLTAPSSHEDEASAEPNGRIEVVTVDVPHAGLQ